MRNNLGAVKAGIEKAEAFIEKYGEQLTAGERLSLYVSDAAVCVIAQRGDAAILGEVFGKHSWKRELAYGGKTFDWKREIDGVRITISDAEDCDMNGSPVPEKAFPIMIKNEEEKP